MLYLIGGTLVGQKWRKNRLVTKFLTDEYFWLTNIFGWRICLSKIISTLKIIFDRDIRQPKICLSKIISTLKIFNFESESDFEIDEEIENENLDNQAESEEKDVIILD